MVNLNPRLVKKTDKLMNNVFIHIQKKAKKKEITFRDSPKSLSIFFHEMLYCLKAHEGSFLEVCLNEIQTFLEQHKELDHLKSLLNDLVFELVETKTSKLLSFEEKWSAIKEADLARKNQSFFQLHPNEKLYTSATKLSNSLLFFRKMDFSVEDLSVVWETFQIKQFLKELPFLKTTEALKKILKEIEEEKASIISNKWSLWNSIERETIFLFEEENTNIWSFRKQRKI
jgi:hypothetical protein